jgi:hypothetical protein
MYPGVSGYNTHMGRPSWLVLSMVLFSYTFFMIAYDTTLSNDHPLLVYLILVISLVYIAMWAIAMRAKDKDLERLLRKVGPSHYRFIIPSSWPVDGLTGIALTRLVASGLTVFPMAPQFLELPPELVARVRYGYVIGPVNRQLLVLNHKSAPRGARGLDRLGSEHYILLVRPFGWTSTPRGDPIVSTLGHLLQDFEELRVSRGLPKSITPGLRVAARF